MKHVLNYDVLLFVFSVLEDRDPLVQISETSHLAREMALPLLLRDVVLTRDIQQIRQLYSCVAVDSQQRAGYIRTLRISCTTVPHEWAMFVRDVEKPLLALLKDAHNLHTLSLTCTLGLIASRSPEICRAIVALPGLTSLAVDEDIVPDSLRRQRWANLDATSRAALGIVFAARDLQKLHLPDVYEAEILSTIIDRHWTTLKEVSFFGEGYSLPFGVGDRRPPGISVNRLVLHDFAYLAPVSKVFPNVRHLTLSMSARSYEASVRLALMAYGKEEGTVWKNLDHLVTDVVGLACAVIRCFVRRLDVDLVLPVSFADTAPRLYTTFKAFLRDSLPTVLTLRTDAATAMTVIPHLYALSPQLRCLRLVIVPYGSLWVPWQPHTLTWLLQSISHDLAKMPSLVYISLDFRFDPALEPALTPSSISDEYATFCFESIVSLRYLKITWRGAAFDPRWWARRHVARNPTNECYAMSASWGIAADERCLELVAL